MITETYTILSEKMADVEKKLRRLEKKAGKYDIPLSYSFGEPYAIDVSHVGEDGRKYTEKYEVCDLTIESEVIRNGNYTVVARIQHELNGNIVNVFEGEMKPEWAKMHAHCDHCNGNHHQKVTVIVRNGEEEKQIGRTCLKEYCGIDPQMIGIFNSFADEVEEYSPDGYDFSTPLCHVFDSVKVLAYAIGAVKAQGYRKSDEWDSNKALIFNNVTNHYHIPEEDIREAEEMAEAIKNMSVEDAVDAMLNNVQTRVKGLYCKADDFGYFAFAPVAYERYMEKIAKKREWEQEHSEMAKRSNYVGAEGQRLEFLISDVKLLTSYESDWGTTYVYRFIDRIGDVLIWFASSKIREENVTLIKGTVKAHSMRDGVKQTIINRVKVLDNTCKKLIIPC